MPSLAWPDRFFPFLFVVANKNGKKRSGHAKLVDAIHYRPEIIELLKRVRPAWHEGSVELKVFEGGRRTT